MRVNRRRLLVSAAAVLTLLAPTSPAPSAAGTASTPNAASEVGRPLEKGRAEPRAKVAARTPSTRGATGSGALLNQVAAARDKGKVVIAVTVRPRANDAVAVAAVTGAARAEGGRQRQSLRQLDTVTVEVPQAAAGQYAAQMRTRADVAKVELVPRRWPSGVPNDPLYPAQAPYLNAVSAPTAWSLHASTPGVRIAVVDTGVDVNHPDLVGRIAGTYNAVTGSTDVTDQMGHGTFVAGVAAATGNNSIGIAGASMGASILAVKVADADGLMYADAIARGVIWAANNQAKVINISLGSTTPGQVERDAIAYASGKGVLVVASAGNAGNTAKNYPAAYPKVVAVGATDTATRGRASFSTFGSWVTVAAPGVSITGTAPTAGSEFFTPTYDVSDGTSFSSPIVAAEAALLSSLRPAVSATDIRTAIVKSAHGYASLGLGAGQVDFRAAYAALRPDSLPTMTLPVSGATVAGVVRLSAASTAPKVRFLANGVALGAPVATSAGTARTTWRSWGVANRRVTLSAQDCSVRDLCNTRSAAVSATLANAAPAITSPRTSRTISGTETFTFRAVAPGGGVAFFIDGIRRGFDASAPYATNIPMRMVTEGAHRVQARSCSVTGTSCAGPVSTLVSFRARALRPRFTAISPSSISPNRDGRSDITRATYYLPDTEYVRLRVHNSAGTVIRGPLNLGKLTRGRHTLTWNGLRSGGVRAGNGTYTLHLSTSRGTLVGSAVVQVRVDRTAPALSSIAPSGTRFYPKPDSYRDKFAPAFSLTERAAVTLTVRTRSGALVRRQTGWRAAGRSSIAWNGKNTAGRIAAAGTYYWTLTAQDAAGNRRVSGRRSVVSAKGLVTRTATLSRRGAQYYSAGGSTTCARASKASSTFSPYGLQLSNTCDYDITGHQIAASFYRFTLPAARSYTSMRLITYGNSFNFPSTLGAAFTRWGTSTRTFTPEITIQSANAWRTIGTVSPSGLVSGSRVVQAAIFVPNDYGSFDSDYDVSHVRLVVTYKALA